MDITIRKTGYNWVEVTFASTFCQITEDIQCGREMDILASDLFDTIYRLYDNNAADESYKIIADLIVEHMCGFEIEALVKRIISKRKDLDFTQEEDE